MYLDTVLHSCTPWSISLESNQSRASKLKKFGAASIY